MERLTNVLNSCFGEQLAHQFTPKAVYHRGLDFLEYVADDCFAVAHRVDEHLTVIKDGDTGEVIGFKLKGFACLLEEILKPLYGPTSMPPELEAVFTMLFQQAADKAFGGLIEKRRDAYREAIKFTRQNNIRFPEEYWQAAA